ncbi:MAG: FHA domain-containing protein [Myxococcales bacterium]|nr:FHA domain-containing protein [Myxococcales bacterium]MDH3485927.1 FHA domain-containing protein [Myxococcales bacterium]
MIHLRQTKGADAGRELEFKQDLIRIGRMPDSDLNFDPEVDLDASGRHAEIRNENGRYLLVDTGSRNGTWLNGQRIKHAALGDGDEIEFGRGGPKIFIASVRSDPSPRELTAGPPVGVPRRDLKFEPLAMPVTTATRLEDLRSQSRDLGRHDSPPRVRATSRVRRASRNSGFLWGAAGVLLLTALALIVSTTLQ